MKNEFKKGDIVFITDVTKDSIHYNYRIYLIGKQFTFLNYDGRANRDGTRACVLVFNADCYNEYKKINPSVVTVAEMDRPTEICFNGLKLESFCDERE